MKRKIKIISWCSAVLLTMCFLASCSATKEKSAAAQNVDTLILSIGEVTIESETMILDAQASYDQLTEEEKAEVEAYDVLIAAKATYDELVAQEHITHCEAVIAEIGEVTIFSGEAIDAAKSAYGALTEAEQAKVANYAVLESAETTYASIVESETKRLLDNAANLYDVSFDKIENQTTYKPKKLEKTMTSRCAIFVSPAVKNGNVALITLYNYYGKNYIYWNSLKIYIDGKTGEKTFAQAPNRIGLYKVIEFAEDISLNNISISAEWFQLLKEIAEGDEVVIRFVGSRGNKDYTVEQTDKDHIYDALKLYIVLLEQAKNS